MPVAAAEAAAAAAVAVAAVALWVGSVYPEQPAGGFQAVAAHGPGSYKPESEL